MNTSLPPKTQPIKAWLDQATDNLKRAAVPSARLDAELLLCDALKVGREWLIAHSNEKVPTNTAKAALKRRLNREPIAYIVGQKEFYGRNFRVTKDTLIPRPESENFIDALKIIQPVSLIDIGTGSGCLAVSTKLELPDCQVAATDISEDALKIAHHNANKYGVDISFLSGSLLEPLKEISVNYQVIIANLPYVPQGLVTSPEINIEPPLALFGGKDGLELYRRFWQQIEKLPKKPHYILTESLKSQHREMCVFAKAAGYRLTKAQGLIQIFRV